MKTRRSLIVVCLVGAVLASSATPARALHPTVKSWNFVAIAHGLVIAFVIGGSYTAERGLEGEEDPLVKACTEQRPVKLQYKTNSGWDTIASGKTNNKGKFSSEEKNREGQYRVKFPAYTAEGGYECFAGTSDPKRYKK